MSLDVKWTSGTAQKYSDDVVVADSSLKEMIVTYVGEKLDPENDAVTIGMAIGVLAEEFPELALAIAEENWIRGYEQGLQDLESFGEE
jgi:hypothetical protein